MGVTFDKSKAFAIRVVNLYKYLRESQKEFVMSKQILRSATSIGANLAEAEYGISKNDFLAKLYIPMKECSETLYWLELLYSTEFLTKNMYESLAGDCIELLKLLKASTKTTKEQIVSNKIK